jgi:hypothetical protein
VILGGIDAPERGLSSALFTKPMCFPKKQQPKQ